MGNRDQAKVWMEMSLTLCSHVKDGPLRKAQVRDWTDSVDYRPEQGLSIMYLKLCSAQLYPQYEKILSRMAE